MTAVTDPLAQSIFKAFKKKISHQEYYFDNGYFFFSAICDKEQYDLIGKEHLISECYHPYQFQHSNTLKYRKLDYLSLLKESNQVIRYLHFIDFLLVKMNSTRYYETYLENEMTLEQLQYLKVVPYDDVGNSSYELAAFIHKDGEIDKCIIFQHVIETLLIEIYFFQSTLKITVKADYGRVLYQDLMVMDSLYTHYSDNTAIETFIREWIFNYNVAPKLDIELSEFNLNHYHILKMINYH